MYGSVFLAGESTRLAEVGPSVTTRTAFTAPNGHHLTLVAAGSPSSNIVHATFFLSSTTYPDVFLPGKSAVPQCSVSGSRLVFLYDSRGD